MNPESTSRRSRQMRTQKRLSRASSEALESRCLLSAFLDVPGLQVEPQSFAADRILVRFRDGVDPSGVSCQRLMSGTNLWKVGLGQGGTVDAALAQYRGRSDVLYAYPDYRLQAAAVWPPSPNDNLYELRMMWGLENTGSYEGLPDRDIDAEAAWAVTRGSGLVVAVIDSGVDWEHVDLAANIWTNPGEVAGNNIDDDKNGYVDDIRGWDFVSNDNNPMDDYGHGTHVAGTIAAVANNDLGTVEEEKGGTGRSVIGVAPEAKIMALKFLDASGGGYTSNAIRALDYAVKMGAKISNNSYGGGPYDQMFFEAIQAATAQGHLFVAAAGNGNRAGRAVNNDSTPFYPASYKPSTDAVISVAASTSSDLYASFSNYGATSVDLAAPGVHIWSTYPLSRDTFDYSPEGHVRLDGTSMATPHVAGAAALVWSANPGLTALEVKQRLLTTVDPISGRDTLTDGRLNAGRAVASAAPTDAPPSVTITSPAAGTTVRDTITITANATDDGGVSQVEFFVENTSIGIDTNGGDGWSMSWDSKAASDGSHTLKAEALDTIGQTASHSVTVLVDNIVDPATARDDFSSGTYTGGTGWASAWAPSGYASIRSDDSGVYAQLLQKTGYLRREASLASTTWTNVRLTFRTRIESFEKNDKALVKISTNGTTWTTVKQFAAADSGDWRSVELSLSGSFSRLLVAFDAEMSAIDDIWSIDDVVLTGTAAATGATVKKAAAAETPASPFSQSARIVAAQSPASGTAQEPQEDEDSDGLDALLPDAEDVLG